MDRYWEANSLAHAPPTPATGAVGYPTDGDLAAAIAPTTPGAWWYHTVNEELRNAIAALGVAPDFTKIDQLATALLASFARAALPAGTLLPFAGNACPASYLLVNGAAVSRASYAGLFAVIGTTYGAGDGATTFNLPDSRGLVLRGLDNGRGLDPGRTLGSYQADSYASHGHGVNDPAHAHNVADPGHGHAVNDPGHSHDIGYRPNASNNSGGGFDAAYPQVSGYHTLGVVTGVSVVPGGANIGIYSAGTGISIQATGGTETRGRNLAVNFIIKY